METIIIFSTLYGASFQCANIIASEIGECMLWNIEELGDPDIKDYSTVIVGAGVKNNTIYKPIRDFLKANKDILLEKNAAYYFCNGKEKSIMEIMNKVFKKELREKAIFVEAFGGYKEYWIPLKSGEELRGIDVEKVRVSAKLLIR